MNDGVRQHSGPGQALVAEEWVLLRLGWRAVLADTGWRVSGEGPDLRPLLKEVRRVQPGLVVIGHCRDVGLAEGVKEAVARGIPTVAVVAPGNTVDPIDLFGLGATGVVARLDGEHELHQALWRVQRAERALSPAALAMVGKGSGDLAGGLTHRERAVLAQAARGASNRQIATALFIGEETVKTHLRNAYSKLGVGNRRDAIGRAAELGLVG